MQKVNMEQKKKGDILEERSRERVQNLRKIIGTHKQTMEALADEERQLFLQIDLLAEEEKQVRQRLYEAKKKHDEIFERVKAEKTPEEVPQLVREVAESVLQEVKSETADIVSSTVAPSDPDPLIEPTPAPDAPALESPPAPVVQEPVVTEPAPEAPPAPEEPKEEPKRRRNTRSTRQ